MDHLSFFQPVPSTVYKDDCGYCFSSLYNETAEEKACLNICLHCYQSFCDDHWGYHSKATDNEHQNVLSVKKTRKDKIVEKSDDDEGSIKKIKLEVKNEPSEDEMYETYWALRRYGSEVLVDSDSCQDKPLQQKVNEILNKKNQDFVEMSNAWQLEIGSCKHIKNLQNRVTNDALILQVAEEKKCNDCSLIDNLWLCLECGNVGCGREQVGIEGNSHAVIHHDTSKHALAVKLGSLTKDSRDIYCYDCNDEVKFEEKFIHDGHLSRYLELLNLDSKQQTEKSLTELNIEQNMNWDFQMTDSQGNELQPLSPNPEVGCGLINLGNSCYMNSIIQCLVDAWFQTENKMLLEPLLEYPDGVIFVNTNFKCQVVKLVRAMTIEAEKYPVGIKPTLFKKLVAGNHEEFKSGRQQDAMEFFTYVLETFDKKLFPKEILTNPNNSFRFVSQDKLKCNNCRRVKYLEQPCENLQVSLNEDLDKQKFLDRIDDFFKPDKSIDFKCPHCGDSTQMEKTSFMKTYPKTLVVNPTRLKLVNWQPVKTSSSLDIPEFLDLTTYKSTPLNSDETLIEEDEESSGKDSFVPNAAVLNQLMETGFSANACKRALFHTGNSSDPDNAMEWIFQHMEDSDVNEPFVLPPPSSQPHSTSEPSVDLASLSMMVSMGLSERLCKKALVLNNGDINRSTEWVFNNMDDDGVLPPPGQAHPLSGSELFGDENSSGKYVLGAVVCHKGNSAHSGHYVVFIKKNINGQDSWVLYNDEKMVLSSSGANTIKDIKENGYIFFYNSV